MPQPDNTPDIERQLESTPTRSVQQVMGPLRRAGNEAIQRTRTGR